MEEQCRYIDAAREIDEVLPNLRDALYEDNDCDLKSKTGSLNIRWFRWGLRQTFFRDPELIFNPECQNVPKHGTARIYVAALRAIEAKYSVPHAWMTLKIQEFAKTLYPSDDSPLIRPPPPPQPEPPAVVIGAVASDVHLGLQVSKQEEFYQWLENRKSGEKVILLGDILDCWIFNRDEKQADVAEWVLASWERLWPALKTLQEKGVEVHYIPGNHDAFMLFIEAGDSLPWSKGVLERSDTLLQIRNATASCRLTEVVSMHYPFFCLENQEILFTHGHFDSWFWRLISGIPKEALGEMSFLATAAVAFGHNHSRSWRVVNNVKDGLMDWFSMVHGIEDMSLTITNAILAAYEGAQAMVSANPDKLLDVMDLAMALYFDQKRPQSREEFQKIRRALLAVPRLQSRVPAGELDKILDSTREMIRGASDAQNITLPVRRTGSDIEPELTPFGNFLSARQLVVGHHHKPRSEGVVHDVGGFVHPWATYFSIEQNGILRRQNC